MKDFKHWLINKKNISDKSAGDVLSRYKRVQKIVSFKIEEKEKEIFNNLEEDASFNVLSPFIRSQLKRSIKLYKEFQLIN